MIMKVEDQPARPAWGARVLTPGDLPHDSIDVRELIDQRIGLVVLRGFVPDWMINAANMAVEAHGGEAEVKQFPNGTLTTIGPWLLKYARAEMPGYLSRASTVERVLGMHGAGSLPALVRDAIQKAFGFDSLSVAKERDGARYAPAVIRIHGPGVDNPLHNDKVGRDTYDLPGIAVRDVDTQISAVTAIQECSTGGVLRVWRKTWEEADEVHKRPGALGYFDAVIDSHDCFDYAPATGDIYVFLPQAYHAVSRVGDGPARRTLGQFIGFKGEDFKNGVVWA